MYGMSHTPFILGLAQKALLVHGRRSSFLLMFVGRLDRDPRGTRHHLQCALTWFCRVLFFVQMDGWYGRVRLTSSLLFAG
jgi:hypothetical protein